MKKFICFVLGLFFLSLSNAQGVNDYLYISIPQKFEDFKQNQYSLNNYVRWDLKKKKYTILDGNMTNWNLDLRQNPCKVLRAEVVDDSSIFKNKVMLRFLTCNDSIIAEYPGVSRIKEFEAGFKDAITQALSKVPTSSVTSDFQPTEQTAVVIVKKKEVSKYNDLFPPEKREVPSESTEVVTADAADTYSNGKIKSRKIELSQGNFILTDPVVSVPYAVFTKTARDGFYTVKLQGKTSTVGYTKGEEIQIEVPQEDGNFIIETFSPVAD